MPVNEAERAAMCRALALAAEGPRGVNPQVGAVVLSPAGDVLAEGRHRGAGTAHAEVDALAQLPADAVRGATVVVTLEPCDHRGRTGPCSLALLEAGVGRVVYALDDPGAESGGGAERLRAGGVDVEAGVEADAAGRLLADWLAVKARGRAHVTVKWAASLDGRIAAADGSSRWITGYAARADVHRRRAAADAIVVGTGTVLADDPALTARRPDGGLYAAQPRPVIVGRTGTPTDAAVRAHPRDPLFLATHDPREVVAELTDHGAQRVFVEGGPTLATAFLAAGLADEVVAYVAPVLLGGPRLAVGDLGIASMQDARRFVLAGLERLGDDVALVLHPRKED